MYEIVPTGKTEPKWARWLREWVVGLAKQSGFQTFTLVYLGFNIAQVGIGNATAWQWSVLIAYAIAAPILAFALLATRHYRNAYPATVSETARETWVREHSVVLMSRMSFARVTAYILLGGLVSATIMSAGVLLHIWPLIFVGIAMFASGVAFIAYGRILEERLYDNYRRTLRADLRSLEDNPA